MDREPNADDDALDRLCRDLYPRLVAALSVQVGSPEVAEELAQDALARACQHWPRVREMERPHAWVFQVAMNAARSWWRRRGAERRALARHGPEAAIWNLESDWAVSVRAELLALPARQRMALVLRHVAGLSVDETAAAMSTTSSAVRTLCHRGAATVRAAMEDETSNVREGARHARP